MKQKIITIILILISVVFLALIWFEGFTVVRIEDVEKAAQSEAFDPETYVNGIWEQKLLPAFDKQSIELSKVLSEIKPDSDGFISKEDLTEVTNKYGLITVGEAHVYMVQGSGEIVGVNTDSSLGTIEVALDDYDNSIKVLLYIGTRIPSDETSVRDAVGFINFGDFKEQTEYGKVGSEINRHILCEVLNSLDKENLIGKRIQFKGAFNIRTFNLIQIDVQDIHVVPIEIEMGE